MAKIIRVDYTPADFNLMVNEFLYTDLRVSLPAESLANVKEHLIKAGPSFHRMFQSYFERTDNVRYDNLTRKMESFSKKLIQYNSDLQGEERKAFILFWKDISDKVEADYIELKDQYLKNSCNYFIWEINKLA